MICTACGFENTASAKFCSECGARLAPPVGDGSAREERKVVSVLFADLVGFTGRAERLDPEDVRAVLGPYHARLRDEIEGFGGTVEKFIGDAVVGVFGAPLAHEDDPERAVRAALAIADWVRESAELQVRVAVNTGEALVNLDARVELGEAMVAGDVVNTASRMQSAAPINGILVGEQTFRSTREQIEYRETDPVEAKGKAEPVPVWEAVQARSRLGVDLAEAQRTDLVGRQRERALLIDALARGRERAEPQLVTVVGVPGIGKTRLLAELFQAVKEDPELIAWRQGRSLPYGTGVAFWALAEIVKAQAGILETDSVAQAATKLRATVHALVAEPAEAEWVEGHLGPLVGVGSDDAELGGARREEAFSAWRRFLEALAEAGPTVLVFEDLQWADDGLLDFVDYLVEWASGVPLLVVCAARPELLSRRPGWGGGKPNAATISLAPLSEPETAHLLALLLDQPVLPAELQSAVLGRAEGNPLYAEEYVRMLQDRNLLRREGSSWRLVATEELPLPETVHGTIAARLDALDEEVKLLIQDASVIGKVFWVGALTALGDRDRSRVERSLHELERRELVRSARRASVAGEIEYVFRHVLVRDVAYGQMPRPRRAEKHGLAAAWIESLERPEDHADMVTHHYLAALEYAEAAGLDAVDLRLRARGALTASGDRAYGLNAFVPAIEFYREAFSRTASDADERAQLLFRLGRARYHGEGAGEDELGEAADALLLSGDVESAAEAMQLLGELIHQRGQSEAGRVHLRRAAELVGDLPASRSKARVLGVFARYLALAGELHDAEDVARQALAVTAEAATPQLEIHAHLTLATVMSFAGDLGGIAEFERALALGKRVPTADVVRAYGNYGSVMEDVAGDVARARELREEGLRLARRLGVQFDVDWLRAEIALDRYHAGEWDEALAEIETLLAQFEHEPHFMESGLLSAHADIVCARGDLAAAYRDTERGLTLGREGVDPQLLYPAIGHHALIALASGRSAEAGSLVDELQRVAGEQRLPPGPWFFIFVAVLVGLGRRDEASDLIREIRYPTPWVEAAQALAEGRPSEAGDRLEAIGARAEAALVRLRAGQALLENDRPHEAAEQLDRAVTFFRSVGATAYLEEAEPLLGAA